MHLGVLLLVFAAPSLGQLPQFRGLYVDKFDIILASSAQSAQLLDWAACHSFNTLALYDLGTILTTPSLTSLLPAFVRSAHAYGMSVIAIGGRGTDFTTRIQPYEAGRTDPLENFDGYNLEREWWNSDGSFATYQGDLSAGHTTAQSFTPKRVMEEYIGWLMDPLGAPAATTAAMCSGLVTDSERTLFHDYRIAPDFSYTQSRLECLADAASAAGKVQDIAVIFSAESTAHGDPNNFMGVYYQTTTFPAAYDAFKVDYDAWTYATKASLRFVGYQVFAYSMAAWSRATCDVSASPTSSVTPSVTPSPASQSTTPSPASLSTSPASASPSPSPGTLSASPTASVSPIAASATSTPLPNVLTAFSLVTPTPLALPLAAIYGISIGVGVPVLALLAILIAWCCCCRKRPAKKRASNLTDSSELSGRGPVKTRASASSASGISNTSAVSGSSKGSSVTASSAVSTASNASTQDASTQDASTQDVSTQDVSAQDASNQDASNQDASNQDATQEDVSDQGGEFA